MRVQVKRAFGRIGATAGKRLASHGKGASPLGTIIRGIDLPVAPPMELAGLARGALIDDVANSFRELPVRNSVQSQVSDGALAFQRL